MEIFMSRRKKKLEMLRSAWGKELERYRDMELISSYHRMLSIDPKLKVDLHTAEDLDLHRLFHKMDRTMTGAGQQYLYHLMHTYGEDETVPAKRFRLFTFLKEKQDIREKIQLALSETANGSSLFIPYIILNKDLPKNRYYPLFYLMSFLTFSAIFLISVNKIMIFPAMFFAVINLIINRTQSKSIYRYFNGFTALNSLIRTAIKLGNIPDDGDLPDEIFFLRQKKAKLTSLRKKLGYLVINKESLNEINILVIEYLNMFLLLDIIAYYRSVHMLEKYREEIHAVFEKVAGLDAAVSVASYLTSIPVYSTPVFTAEKRIEFKGLYHPLVGNAVANDLNGLDKSMLITGSNMAGKTTFIKTVGINFILAQTLFFCHADKIRIPGLKVLSFIRRSDDLSEGKSYFFVEIETIRKFLSIASREDRYLFLIDEIFRGTNTVERLATSAAVLKVLSRNNTAFVTTHDIELQEMLDGAFRMFHFSEQVRDGRYFFDYRLREGNFSSGNAVKLLEITGYPEEVVREAGLLVREISGI